MTHRLTLSSICRSVTYILCSSNFAAYLEDYLMEKHCTWDNGTVWLKDRPCKIYVGQWPIFHGPLILPYIIVRLKLFLYIKKWHRPGVFVPLWALALVYYKFNLWISTCLESLMKFHHCLFKILRKNQNVADICRHGKQEKQVHKAVIL